MASHDGLEEKKYPRLVYKTAPDRLDILHYPEMYIGATRLHKRKLWVYETLHQKMVYRTVSYSPGLLHIFEQLLFNVCDLVRSNSITSLEVFIEAEGTISVKNFGAGIPIIEEFETAEGEGESKYLPEIVFSKLGCTFDEHGKGCGAKYTNIFSNKFVVETDDGVKMFKQVFENNMSLKGEHQVRESSKNQWTKVTFKPDLDRFQMKSLDGDIIALMNKRVVDMAAWLGNSVDVRLNGHLLLAKSFEDYAGLYLNSKETRFYSKVNERWEICVSLSDGSFQQVSFVNFIATTKGGTHVDYITDQITRIVKNDVNKINEASGNVAKVKSKEVKQHLRVFVKAIIDEPLFISVTNEGLISKQDTFGSTCDVPESVFGRNVATMLLQSWADLKLRKELKKIPKLVDAPGAGVEGKSCSLIICEGDSAQTFAMDCFGIYPLQGSLPNVWNRVQSENKHIQNLMKIIGLKPGQEYKSAKNLRYYRLIIMADPDADGSHFKGLVINLIYYYWPSLLKVLGFICDFRSPLVKAVHPDGSQLSFYTIPEFDNWISLGHTMDWIIAPYKGLGTNSEAEAIHLFGKFEKRTRYFFWAANDGKAFDLAFKENKTAERKKWINEYELKDRPDFHKFISYQMFFDEDFRLCAWSRHSHDS